MLFFYPFVYRIDLSRAKQDPIRKHLLIDNKGSALVGSNEFKIHDLEEVEDFDILFLDFENESLLVDIYPTRSQSIGKDMQDLLNNRAGTSQNVYHLLLDYLVSPQQQVTP